MKLIIFNFLLRESFMKKSITKSKRIVLIMLSGLFLLLHLVANVYLGSIKNKILGEVEKIVTHPVTYKQALFFFPNQIIIQNASISKDATHSESMLQIPNIRLSFSLYHLVRKREIVLDQVLIDKPQVKDYKTLPIVKDEIVRIVEYIRQLPRVDLKLIVQSASFRLGRFRNESAQITMDANFDLVGDTITIQGDFQKDLLLFDQDKMERVAGMEYEYSFKGSFEEEYFLLQRFEINEDQFKMNFWGNVRNQNWQLNGFAFIRDSEKGQRVGESQLSLDQEGISHYFNDIDCQFKLTNNMFDIRRLQFSFDGTPFEAGGKFLMESHLSFSIHIVGNPTKEHNNILKPFENIQLALNGYYKDSTFFSNGSMKFHFNEQTGQYPLESVEFSFKDLQAYTKNETQFMMKLMETKLSLNNEKEYFEMNNLTVLLDITDPFNHMFELKGPLYDGKFNSILHFATGKSQATLDVSANINFEDVQLSKVKGLLFDFSTLNGSLSSRLSFQNRPANQLNGEIVINNGTLNNHEFQDWLSVYFDLDPLKSVSYDRLAATFVWNNSEMDFQDVAFQSEDVKANGYFRLGQKDLVASKFSLAFTRGLMKHSDSFKPVLKRLDENKSIFKFDFQLSGKLEAINFEWSPSELKSEIANIIPGFMQRKLERSVEQLI